MLGRLLFSIISLGLLFDSVSTGSAQTATNLLEQAVFAEEMQGDLGKAIRLYQRIVLEPAARRDRQAQAQYRLGICFLKQGETEKAAGAFRELTEMFPEQEALALKGRREMAMLRSAESMESLSLPSQGNSLTLVLDEAIRGFNVPWKFFEFSPDGEKVVFMGSYTSESVTQSSALAGFRQLTANGALFIAGRDGSTVKPFLTAWGGLERGAPNPDTPGSPMLVNLIGWSPDGSKVAISVSVVSESYPGKLWEVPRESLRQEAAKAYETVLATIDADGGEPTVFGDALGKDQEFEDAWWGPDGQSVFFFNVIDRTLVRRGLDGSQDVVAQVDLSYGTVHKTRLNVTFGGHSPNGKWISYSRTRREMGTERDLWLMPAAGGDPIRVNQKPIIVDWGGPRPNRVVAEPTWETDGNALLYIDGENTYRISIDPDSGQPTGDPEQITNYQDTQVAYPQSAGAQAVAFYLVRRQSVVQVRSRVNPNDVRVIARGRNASISPDGSEVYFQSEADLPGGIYAYSLDSEQTRQVVSLSQAVPEFRLSPNGEEISYFLEEGPEFVLYVASVDGGSPRRLTEVPAKRTCHCARWSPSSQELAFVSGNQLLVISAQGGAPRVIGEAAGWYYDQPEWSPDGQSVVLPGYLHSGDPKSSILVFPANGGEVRSLGSGSADDQVCPTFHPDLNRITFFDQATTRIREASLDGTVSSPIFDHQESWEYCGQWAPDGSFYFEGSVNGTWRVFVFDPETREIAPLFSPSSDIISVDLPAMSQDQQTLVWSSQREIRQVWVMGGQ